MYVKNMIFGFKNMVGISLILFVDPGRSILMSLTINNISARLSISVLDSFTGVVLIDVLRCSLFSPHDPLSGDCQVRGCWFKEDK